MCVVVVIGEVDGNGIDVEGRVGVELENEAVDVA